MSLSPEEMHSRRPAWVPHWMYSVPDAWGAFADEHPLRVEELRDGDERVVRVELPGVDPDRDVAITIDDDVLVIRGERRLHRADADREGFRSEFTYGTFVRRVRVPSTTGQDDVEASYQDGILEVRLPCAADEGGGTRVPVRRG